MDLYPEATDDVLALPLPAQLFRELTALRRAASTQELAQRLGRHPNTVRVQLRRLADAGLVERRVYRQARGRPRDCWAVSPDAAPGGRPPEAYGQLSRWLTQAVGTRGDLAAIEAIGRRIGRELAPAADHRGLGEALADALAALGFAPRREPRRNGGLLLRLRNCPYRDAVAQNPPVVCTLHRGLTLGLLEALEPDARLAGFVPKDPRVAGCEVAVAAADEQATGAPPGGV
jgi:predicted ArsR family transcriptional regulator